MMEIEERIKEADINAIKQYLNTILDVSFLKINLFFI